MPSPIAHSTTAYLIFKLTSLNSRSTLLGRHRWQDLAYIILIGNVADLDFIPQLLLEGKFHRGPSHSLSLAFLISLSVAIICYAFNKPQVKQLFLITLGIYTSHLFLDYWTAGGAGMKLFWPFTNSYFMSSVSFFPSVRHSEGLLYSGHIIFIVFETIYSFFLMTILNIIFKSRRNKIT